MPCTAYRQEIEVAAATHGLDPNLVEGLVLVESSGHTDAFRFEPRFWHTYLAHQSAYRDATPRRVSASYGLMQIMYPVAVEHGFQGDPEGLFVPTVGLTWGCRHLAKLLTWAENNLPKALGAYNAGRGGWHTEAGQAYARRVLAQIQESA